MVRTSESRRSYEATYRAAHREKLRERNRLWRINNPERYAAQLARNRANYKVKYKITNAAFRYNLTVEQVKLLFAIEECEICGGTEPRLDIDHSHESGLVRGRLCANCNRAIGLFKEDPSRLASAILYLEERRGGWVAMTTGEA